MVSETPSLLIALEACLRTPDFAAVAPDLWQWNDWFIAFACGKFWLLTAAAREFGPFECFEQAYSQTRCLC